jgi:hypothetical protein
MEQLSENPDPVGYVLYSLVPLVRICGIGAIHRVSTAYTDHAPPSQ